MPAVEQVSNLSGCQLPARRPT